MKLNEVFRFDSMASAVMVALCLCLPISWQIALLVGIPLVLLVAFLEATVRFGDPTDKFELWKIEAADRRKNQP